MGYLERTIVCIEQIESFSEDGGIDACFRLAQQVVKFVLFGLIKLDRFGQCFVRWFLASPRHICLDWMCRVCLCRALPTSVHAHHLLVNTRQTSFLISRLQIKNDKAGTSSKFVIRSETASARIRSS